MHVAMFVYADDFQILMYRRSNTQVKDNPYSVDNYIIAPKEPCCYSENRKVKIYHYFSFHIIAENNKYTNAYNEKCSNQQFLFTVFVHFCFP